MSHIAFKIGFIGGGLNSAVGNTHRIASQMDHRWALDAGCFSTNIKINQETASKWGIKQSRLYDDWRVLLSREKAKLDTICLLTPTSMHSEMAIEALNHGFAVICEKAMATSSKEVAAICQAFEALPVFLRLPISIQATPCCVNSGKWSLMES